MADNRLSNPSSVFINSPNVLTIIVNLQTKKKPVQKWLKTLKDIEDEAYIVYWGDNSHIPVIKSCDLIIESQQFHWLR